MTEKAFYVPAIHCNHCVMTVKRELGELQGVVSVSGDAATKMITVQWEEPATWDRIKSLLVEINYPPAE